MRTGRTSQESSENEGKLVQTLLVIVMIVITLKWD